MPIPPSSSASAAVAPTACPKTICALLTSACWSCACAWVNRHGQPKSKKTNLVQIDGPHPGHLHPVAQIHKILIRPLLLLGHQPIAFDADLERGAELQRDAELRTLRHLVEAHLREEVVDAGDGDGLGEDGAVFAVVFGGDVAREEDGLGGGLVS